MSEIPVYKHEDLVYAADARCKCGAGLAYVPNAHQSPVGPNWVCGYLMTTDIGTRVKEKGELFKSSGILEDANGVEHDAAYPFAFYEIKSEKQPSANGRTTRPQPTQSQ